MRKRILLIEDEPGLIRTLTDRLKKEGYQVESARNGRAGLTKALEEPFHLIILDVMLPEKNGFDVCRDLRQQKILTPIIILTARGQVIDRVLGLKLGADDYLVKPFDMLELLARIEAILRRMESAVTPSSESYQFGSLKIDLQREEVEREGKRVELSAREYSLLCHLIAHRGMTLSRNELLDAVWGYNEMPSTRTVDVHIAWLRQKLENNPHHPKYILTVHGLGYKFIG